MLPNAPRRGEGAFFSATRSGGSGKVLPEKGQGRSGAPLQFRDTWERRSPRQSGSPREAPGRSAPPETGAAFTQTSSPGKPAGAARPSRAAHHPRPVGKVGKVGPRAPRACRALSRVLKGLREQRAGGSARPQPPGHPALPFQPPALSPSRPRRSLRPSSAPTKPSPFGCPQLRRTGPRAPTRPGPPDPCPQQPLPGAAALSPPPPPTFFFRSRERFLRFLLDSSFSFCSWRACASMSLIFFSCLAA